MTTPRRAAAFLAALLALAPAPGAAAGKPMSYTASIDLGVTGVALAGALVPELGKSAFASDTCKWCHPPLAGGAVEVNGFDAALRGAFMGLGGVNPATWARVTDGSAFGLLPLSALALDLVVANDGVFDANFGTDALIVTEATAIASMFTQLVKFPVSRERPFVAYDSPFSADLRHGTETVADDNLSFFSGHSSVSLAITTSMSRVIELRTGRKIGYATLVPLGIATSLLRMAADKHWGTDVLTGMLVGAAVGWIVPTLHAPE